MNKFDSKKQNIIETLADYLLAHGMKGASLRQLAVAAGTSDRMLLHYFADKEELMTAVLVQIEERLELLLENSKSEQMELQVLIPHLAEMLNDSNIRPYMNLALELVASVVGGEAYYRRIAKQMSDSFFEWISSAIRVENEEERRSLASVAFAMIEGFVLLDAVDSNLAIANALEGIANLGKCH